MKKNKKESQFKYNRAFTKDRPLKSEQCRSNSSRECEEKGHDFQFHRFDRYGCCKRCGDEILT